MKVSFIHALDQPLNKQRLAHHLAAALNSSRFDRLYIVVAAVSRAALLRLDDFFVKWTQEKKRITAIYGVDIAATSIEGLQYSMQTFSEVYIARIPGIRFHPKMYIFKGKSDGLVFYGSNNFTVPGTELNFEACVRIDYSLPADNVTFQEQMRGVEELLVEEKSNTVYKLTGDVLSLLEEEGLAVPEKALGKVGETTGASPKPASKLPKSSLKKIPPSAMPKKKLAPTVPPVGMKAPPVIASPVSESVEVLVMQVKPHHNGEILLSKVAVDQNPTFFGWPFTGKTVPKLADNVAYPQRDPDPVVDVAVYGDAVKPVFSLSAYGLNTVYYSKKHEIRITCSPLIPHVPEYSIMVMKRGLQGTSLDYDIEIYRPDSSMYPVWLAACNQTMPGGGAAARKFGWL